GDGPGPLDDALDDDGRGASGVPAVAVVLDAGELFVLLLAHSVSSFCGTSRAIAGTDCRADGAGGAVDGDSFGFGVGAASVGARGVGALDGGGGGGLDGGAGGCTRNPALRSRSPITSATPPSP